MNGAMKAIENFSWNNIISMILVAALWGCTNPFLARGAASHPAENVAAASISTFRKWIPKCMHSLLNFCYLSVLLPYIINQCGSILYYYLLASCNLSVVVPCCNALSLAFALGTSYILGERVNYPLRAILGSVLVTLGVAICMLESSTIKQDQQQQSSTSDLHRNGEL
mmetsp:Transcript_6078/g.8876  ORF Transcript_6078/g.8876 Transcript_6078/m.8876 type:complete len:168 (-) Transcript_6078:671-1174(-)